MILSAMEAPVGGKADEASGTCSAAAAAKVGVGELAAHVRQRLAGVPSWSSAPGIICCSTPPPWPPPPPPPPPPPKAHLPVDARRQGRCHARRRACCRQSSPVARLQAPRLAAQAGQPTG
jgi:hypothetical protein